MSAVKIDGGFYEPHHDIRHPERCDGRTPCGCLVNRPWKEFQAMFDGTAHEDVLHDVGTCASCDKLRGALGGRGQA